MKNATIQEAKSQLLELINCVLQGEHVTIINAGKPLVRLVPCEEVLPPRVPGFWQGQVKIADDFDDISPEIIRAFDGE